MLGNLEMKSGKEEGKEDAQDKNPELKKQGIKKLE